MACFFLNFSLAIMPPPFKFSIPPMKHIEKGYLQHHETSHHGQLGELDTAISTIACVAKLLNKRGKTDAGEKTLLKILKDGALNIVQLLNSSVLAEPASAPLLKQRCALHTLLQDCVAFMQPKADEKKQQIVLDAVKVTLQVNKIRMWGIINNILNNAIKFSTEGGTVLVKLKTVNGGATALITVQDNGIGMAASMQNKIFSSGKKKKNIEAGTLFFDLATSLQIVEAHNGKLWFESEDGNGTTFFIELPVT